MSSDHIVEGARIAAQRICIGQKGPCDAGEEDEGEERCEDACEICLRARVSGDGVVVVVRALVHVRWCCCSAARTVVCKVLYMRQVDMWIAGLAACESGFMRCCVTVLERARHTT